MAKRPRKWNQSIYEKRLKSGRGSGEGLGYQPWICVQDFPSYGTISRVQGWKTGRVHHFMSSLEQQYFFLLEWADTVTDIREQYPLLDVASTVEIAQLAGITHPYDRESGFPYVLSSDFLIMTNNGPVSRAVKPSRELNNRRVLEKLEIERRFWQDRHVDWRLVTEKEINRTKAKNIEWLHSSKTLHGIPCSSETINTIALEFMDQYIETEISILDICGRIDNHYPVPPGIGLKIFKYLAVNKRISVNMNQPLMLSERRTQYADTVCKVKETMAV